MAAIFVSSLPMLGSFRTSTRYPPPVSVNARCIEGIDIGALTIGRVEGRAFS